MTINQAYLEAKRQISFKSVVGKTNGNGHTLIQAKTADQYVIYPKSSERMNELKNESVNLVITSPPYYSKRNYGIPDKAPSSFSTRLVSTNTPSSESR